MTELVDWVKRRRTSQLRRQAIEYVQHGWPIARLAIQRGGRCACRLMDCVEPHLTVTRPPVITTTAAAEDAFCSGRWEIALLTLPFDVLELPARSGAPLNHQLKSQCPTAIAPATRRWHFFVTPGSVPRRLAEAAGGQVFTGSDAWVLAPGTYTETTGRTRWLTPPYQTRWRPYQRRDAIDAVLSTVDWSAAEAPTAPLPKLVDDALK